MRYARGHNPVGVGDICLSKPKAALADSGNLGLEGRTPLGFQAHASGMKTNFPSHHSKPPKTAENLFGSPLFSMSGGEINANGVVPSSPGLPESARATLG